METKLSDAERIKRAREIQNKNSQLKQAANKESPDAQRKILDETKSKIAGINGSALDRLVVSAQWTDRNGAKRSSTGSSAFLPGANETDDLLVRSNRRSIEAIVRACRRADRTVDELISVWREKPAALPADLPGYMAKLIAELPSLDTIKLEIIREPGDSPKKAKS